MTLAERVYLPDSPLAHVADGPEAKAERGKSPFPVRWRGLDDYSERQAAYALTLCLGCVNALRNQGGLTR